MTFYSANDANRDAPPRIILVEGDEALRAGLATDLRAQGVAVTEAGSGMAFYKMFRTQGFDIVILDTRLPDTNGLDIAHDIAMDGQVGVILLSPTAGKEDRKRALAAGADLYLSKPVDGEELFSAVRNLARRLAVADIGESRGSENARWHLDISRNRLITPNGQILELSGREVMLMEQFAKAGGEPIARATLATLLGYAAPSTENRSLDAALRRLRQKTIDAGIEPPFVAIHGIGVRFSAPLAII